jgi:hypothetical protein
MEMIDRLTRALVSQAVRFSYTLKRNSITSPSRTT